MSREVHEAEYNTEEAGRHATNLELFLDLVFVFAVGQIVSVLDGELNLATFARGLLLAWLTWWLWTQFAWLGTSIDLSERSRSQLLVLIAIPLTLLMAIAIPDAYGSTGLQFAGVYLVVNLLCLAIQGRGLWSDPKARAAWLQYGPIAAIAPLLLVIGAYFEGNARTGLWVVAAVINVFSALAAGRQNSEGSRQWRVDPTHFAERHALFVIIVLGEVVVAIGVAASGSELGFSTLIGAGVIAAAAVACAFWWTYFAFIPDAVETALRQAALPKRGRVARDLFTFWHFPLIFGILLFALVAEHVVVDPAHHLDWVNLGVLVLGVALFASALDVIKWLAVRRIGPERLIAIGVVGVICALVGPHVPGALTLAMVSVVLVAMQVITVRRFENARSTFD